MGREIHGVSLIILLMPFFSFYAGETQDPIEVARTHLINKNNKVDKLFFSPEDSKVIEQIIIGLIRSSKEIKGALYLLTYQPFIKEFIEAKKRGVKIKLVFDKSALTSKSIYALPGEGIPLLIYHPDAIRNFQALMHLKTVIFYGAFSGARDIVAFGSMNWSGNGLNRNSDQITFRDDSEIVQSCTDKISTLLEKAHDQVNPVPKKETPLERVVADSFVNEHRKIVINRDSQACKKKKNHKKKFVATQPARVSVLVKTFDTVRRIVKVR